ncbi:MAG TPA: MTAP family purine nucleoside phosphorylase [Methanoregulaceae archaeon]|nr:MTAP family purine nucleoside phosphorylase [Methanoregulaceae archaeon]
MLAVIGGTSLLDCPLPPHREERVDTPFGTATVLFGERVLILLRHINGRPPHRINHRAHLAALALSGADRVVLIGSTGSLRREIPPGSLLIPDDYATTAPVPTVHDRAIVHASPSFSPSFAARLATAVPEARRGGVYVQTRGPRLETRAEIRALALYADVVGMTCASEATLANELGLEVAALCTVENYANGISDDAVSFESIIEAARANSERMAGIVGRIIARMWDEHGD